MQDFVVLYYCTCIEGSEGQNDRFIKLCGGSYSWTILYDSKNPSTISANLCKHSNIDSSKKYK